MKPSELGKKYNKIAHWWNDHHKQSSYGLKQLEQALKFLSNKEQALDVGCGSGGRLIDVLEEHDFCVTGLDVSTVMLELATKNHPQQNFLHQDICTWETHQKFDLIVAWDSIFHLPLEMQKPVVNKLCGLLQKDGVLLYTFGDTQGEHVDNWREDTFYYSSIGINENIKQLINNGLSIRHLECDQYPEKHVYVIASKI